MPKHSIAILLNAVCPIVGVDPEDLLRKVPWPETIRLGPDLLVSGQDFVVLFQTLAEMAGERADPIAVGKAMASGPILPIFLALSIAPNMAEGFRRLARYKTLFGPMAINLSQSKAGLRVEIVADDPTLTLPAQLSAPIAVFLVEKARAHSLKDIVPLRVTFPGGLIEDDVASAYFGTNIVHGANVVIDFATTDALAPFVSVNDELWVDIEADLERQLQEQAGASDFPAQVEGAIRRALNVGPVRVEAICEELGVSRSTMQRQLAAQGQAYQSILNRVRRDLAVRYLTKSTLTPGQVAGLIGFADPKSFQRAFKSWTGKPPERFRQEREV
ncbi:MAG: helix-turn-helix domain-containing protein [Erythrobacter sp.]